MLTRNSSMQNMIAAATAAAIADGIGKIDTANPSTSNDVHDNANGSSDHLIINRMQKENNSLRRGKWTVEEEAYSTRLIQEFRNGRLPLTDGTTLRTFLSIMLNCDPMRISKKFTGGNCIGKQVFKRCNEALDKRTPEEVEQNCKELAELEQQYLDRIATNGSGSKSPSSVPHPQIGGVTNSMPLRRSRLAIIKPEERETVIDVKSPAILIPCKHEEDSNSNSSLNHCQYPIQSPRQTHSIPSPGLGMLSNDNKQYSEDSHYNVKSEEVEYPHDGSSSNSDLDINIQHGDIDNVSHEKHALDESWHALNGRHHALSFAENMDGMPRAQSMTFLPYGAGMNGSTSIQDLVMLLGSHNQSGQNLQVNNSNTNLASSDGDHMNDSTLSNSIPAFFKESHVSDPQRWGPLHTAPSLSNHSSADDFMSLLTDCNNNDYPSHFMNGPTSTAGYHGRTFYLPGQGSFVPPLSVGQILQPYPHVHNPQMQIPYHLPNPFTPQRFRQHEQFSAPYNHHVDPPNSRPQSYGTRQTMAPPLSLGHYSLYTQPEELDGGEGNKTEPKIGMLLPEEDVNDCDLVRRNSKRYAEFAEGDKRSQRVKNECGEIST